MEFHKLFVRSGLKPPSSQSQTRYLDVSSSAYAKLYKMKHRAAGITQMFHPTCSLEFKSTERQAEHISLAHVSLRFFVWPPFSAIAHLKAVECMEGGLRSPQHIRESPGDNKQILGSLRQDNHQGSKQNHVSHGLVLAAVNSCAGCTGSSHSRPFHKRTTRCFQPSRRWEWQGHHIRPTWTQHSPL
jgi:hypothetical protein